MNRDDARWSGPAQGSSLRVLVVHNWYRSGQPSGEDRVVEREMRELVAAGHRVSTFERRSDDIAAMPLLQKARIPLTVPWNASARAELATLLRRDRPDIVHIHSTFPMLSPAVVAACNDVRVPVVATLHNYLMACPAGTFFRAGRFCSDCVGRSPLPAVRHGCYRGSSVATIPLAISMVVTRRLWWSGVDRFFCISAAQRDLLIEAGMPAERLAVKHNFVDEPSRRRVGSGEHVLFIGRLTAEKGLSTLMRAWDATRDTGGLGLPLVIAGAGPMEGEVAAWARGRDDVRCLGLRTREECADLTARAAVVVAPSEWREAFGLGVVEAMAAAVPAVAAGHGAFRELIDDGVTGSLHAPGDPTSLMVALRDVVTGRERNMLMGAAARARYERRFTREVGLEVLTSGYRAVLAEAARATR